MSSSKATVVNQTMPECRKVSRIRNSQNYVATFAIEEIIEDIIKGMKILVLMRGLPGSGKSYLSRSILEASLENPVFSEHIFSADNFFMKSGRYVYDISKISEAHSYTQRAAYKAMYKGNSPIIIDNTNTQLWEMQPYCKMAMEYGYKICVLEASTKWSWNINRLANNNEHGVPKATIKRMQERYIQNITAEVLLLSLNLPLHYQKSPQQRSYPPAPSLSNSAMLSNMVMSTNVTHNHNSMNKDLKLPDLWQNSQQEYSLKNNSQCEVSNVIEISDDDENDKCEIKSVPPIRDKIYGNFSLDNIDFSSWGINEKTLKSWNIVTPLKDESSSSFMDFTTNNIEEKIQKIDKGCNTSLSDFYVNHQDASILYGQYRDINPPGKRVPLNKSGMLDKGCSTNNDIITDRNEDLKKLSDIFQNIPPSCIRDMYDDCNSNFDMAFEIFLEDNKDYSNMLSTESNSAYDSATGPKLSKKLSHSDPKISSSEELCHMEASSSGSNSSSPVVHNLSTNLINEPCNSQNSLNFVPPLIQPSISKNKRNKSSESTMGDSDSDSEFDNCSSPGENDTRSEDNDIIEFSLGNTLIEQLEKEFGDPGNNYPKGFQPVVQVPKSFARQLFAFYVESVYQQMETQQNVLDKLVAEDEAFARKLFEEENGIQKKQPAKEGLREIINEQIAMNLHEKEISKWKNCAPNDLAAQLTRKKLYATFPTVNKDALLEIFHANNYDYKQTVEDLLISVDPKDVCNDTNIREPPITQPLLQELEKANQDFGTNKDEEDDVLRSSQYYREEATEYLQKRQDLYQKAQQYYSQGQMEVAQFYSNLAQKQTQLYDMSNNKAATMLLEEHSRRLQNFDTLDLHFLFVKEAIPALDMFIDRNINLLQGGKKTSQSLLVITGRGNRSKNGLSKIKPAVISRLKTRKISFVHLNPGLLKIKVHMNTATSSDL
ncbi:hypothetical protein WA026_009307 [Henosepilachna vigintioctopunctata]